MQFHYLRCRQCTSPGCEVVRFTHQAIVVSGIETQTFRESSGGFQSCVWRQGQSENKNHQHPSQCSSHLQKKKRQVFWKKLPYMTTHSPAPLKSLSTRVFASLLAPPLHGAHWLLAPVGFGNRWKWWWDIWMVFWYIQELHVFFLITIPCSLVPLPKLHLTRE